MAARKPAKKAAAKRAAPAAETAAKRTVQVPEVRQNQDPEDVMFGAVAVASVPLIPGNPPSWGVMEPVNPANGRGGGHWANDEQVKDWKVLS